MSVIAHDGKVVVAGGKALSFDNLIALANNTTGETDTTLTDAVQSLIDGFGGGGINALDGSITFAENQTGIVSIPNVVPSGVVPIAFVMYCPTASAYYEIYETRLFKNFFDLTNTRAAELIGGSYEFGARNNLTAKPAGAFANTESDGSLTLNTATGQYYYFAAKTYNWKLLY